MSDHKISVSGLSIECHAEPTADCRKRPDCATDFWNEEGCQAHDREHKLTTAHECWQVEWINAGGLDESYKHWESWNPSMDARAGAPVNLVNELPEAMLWEYEETPND